jgi:hypothetical protein
MITGLLLATYMSASSIRMQKERMTKTSEHMALAQRSLQNFFDTHRRFPCPASAAVSSGPDFLREADCNKTTLLPEGISNVSGVGGKTVSIGYLPARTLGLADMYSQDGWGSHMTYAVSLDLTQENLMGDPYQKGAIEIVDGSSQPLIDPAALYALISPGVNRMGTYTASGFSPSCLQDSYEGENCDQDGIFLRETYSRADGPHYFDDTLVHDRDILYSGNSLIQQSLDRLFSCQRKGAFFDPDDPNADNDGCLGTVMPSGTCGGDLVMKGVDSSGQITCVPNMQVGTCPAGQVLIGYNENGTMICSDVLMKIQICAQSGLIYSGLGSPGTDANGCRKAG